MLPAATGTLSLSRCVIDMMQLTRLSNLMGTQRNNCEQVRPSCAHRSCQLQMFLAYLFVLISTMYHDVSPAGS